MDALTRRVVPVLALLVMCAWPSAAQNPGDPCEIGIAMTKFVVTGCTSGWEGEYYPVQLDEFLGYTCFNGRCRECRGYEITRAIELEWDPPAPGNCYSVHFSVSVDYQGTGQATDCNNDGTVDCCVGNAGIREAVLGNSPVFYELCECP